MKKYLISVALLLVLPQCHKGASEPANDRLVKIQEEKLLRVGMDISTGPPFIQKGRTRELYGGFEYDVAEYLAGKLGAKLQLVPSKWGDLLDQLRKGKIDIALNAIEPPASEGLPENISFSENYYVSFQQLVVLTKDNFTFNLSDLQKKKVGVLEDSAAAAILEELNRVKQAGISIQPFSEPGDLFKALSKRKLKAIFTERAMASWFSWKQDELKLTGEEILKRPYVVAVQSQESRLLERIDVLLQKAKRNGSFKAIFKKWHIN